MGLGLRVAGTIAALAALAAPAIAAAPSGTPFALDQGDPAAIDGHVSLDGRENALFVWGRFQEENGITQVMSRTRSADGTLAPRVPLTGVSRHAGFFDLQLATGPAGNAVIAWTARSRDDRVRVVRARTRSRAGDLGPAVAVSPRSEKGFLAAVTVAADGSGIVVWRRGGVGRNVLRARWMSRTGPLGPVVAISDPRRDAPSVTTVALANGDALLLWSAFVRGGYRVFGRTVSRRGALGRVAAVSTLSADSTSVVAGATTGANAVVAWRTDGGRVQSRAWRAGGRLGPIASLSPLVRERGLLEPPALAVARDGRAAVVWTENNRTTAVARARLRTRRGTFGAPLDVSTPGLFARLPQVAIDGSGRALVAWTEAADNADAADRVLVARRVAATGGLGPVARVSAPGESTFLFDIAVRPDGRAAVVWGQPRHIEGVGTFAGPLRGAVLAATG
jgi:hypothetical protein